MDPTNAAAFVGQRLGVYEMQSRIGAGGMGTVYRALDTNLHRVVAVKVLSDGLATPAARRRFQREAQTASSLNHPHILTVHDAGEHDGRQFLVTEFVDGGTLRDWLGRGPHDWRQALELLIGVADGLAVAHEAGILHRDIKPENILITRSGYAKLADFGLAKLADPSELSDAATVTDLRTRPGAIVGTAAYMSPEQARGHQVDARSDVFSFGVVLYEALAARRPFGGPSDVDLLHAIVHDQPPPLPSALPPACRTLVEKSLEKNPVDRFQSMRELVVDMRRLLRQSGESAVRSSARTDAADRSRPLIAIAALVVVVAAGLFAWSRRPSPAPIPRAAASIRSLAVLPLDNLSGDSAQDYFVAGVQEGLTTDLTRIGIEKVVAKSSSDVFKGSKKSPADIGRELGVDGLVTGAVMRDGARVRVTAQLVNVSSGDIVWANRYERNASDVLALQNEIVSAIANELRTTLSAEQKARQSATPRVDPAAYDVYLRARSLYASFTSSTNPQTLAAAISDYKRAIELDPTYAPSYAGLSVAYQTGSEGSWYAPKDAFPNARAAALKAVELDDQLAAAHAALSGALLLYDWNWESAERESTRALQLNPDSVEALIASVTYFTLIAGRPDEAARTSQRIVEVDPLNPFSRVQPVWVALFSGRFDDAVGKANALTQLWPDNLMGPWFVSSAQGAKGRRPETLAACRRVLEMLSGAFVMQPLAECAGNLGLVGETAEARRLIQRLEHPPAGIWIDPVPMGDAYAGVGDADRAIQSYQRGLEERSPNMIYLKTNWFPNAFRDDPRFQQLLAQMNFPR